MPIDKRVEQYYAKGGERDRLRKGYFQLERVRSQEIIQRYLPKEKKLKILDIGGGCGFYSFWLRKFGHKIYLLDPVEKNIEIARGIAKRKKIKLEAIELGDARQLRFRQGYFDIVLMMGPLYHLTKKQDRFKALKEARRVLRAGGILFGAAISKYAFMMDCFYGGLIKDPASVKIMNRDIRDGQHRNYTGKFDYFTTAFLFHPEALRKEVREAGFRSVEILAIEAFGAHIPDFNKNWHDPKFMRVLLQSIDRVEKDKSLLGISSHMMAIARKTIE
jgi:ubiquinone/menaquinone biosynthesis C-methylase UbiE